MKRCLRITHRMVQYGAMHMNGPGTKQIDLVGTCHYPALPGGDLCAEHQADVDLGLDTKDERHPS